MLHDFHSVAHLELVFFVVCLVAMRYGARTSCRRCRGSGGLTSTTTVFCILSETTLPSRRRRKDASCDLQRERAWQEPRPWPELQASRVLLPSQALRPWQALRPSRVPQAIWPARPWVCQP